MTKNSANIDQTIYGENTKFVLGEVMQNMNDKHKVDVRKPDK